MKSYVRLIVLTLLGVSVAASLSGCIMYLEGDSKVTYDSAKKPLVPARV